MSAILESFKGELLALNEASRVALCEINAQIMRLDSANKTLADERFGALSNANSNDIRAYVNKLKSRRLTEETDEILLEILVEIYNKITQLESKLDARDNAAQMPTQTEQIAALAYDIFYFKNAVLEAGGEYFIELVLPIFPSRNIAFFATAKSPKIAKISKILGRDKADLDQLLIHKEREMILRQKGGL